MSEPSKLRVATFPDGSQVLITDWPDGTTDVAKRRERWAVWGPPVRLEEAP